MKLFEEIKNPVFKGELKADEKGNIWTPAAERADLYVIDNRQFTKEKPLIFNGKWILDIVQSANDTMLTVVCTDSVEDARGVDKEGLAEITKKWTFLNDIETHPFEGFQTINTTNKD